MRAVERARALADPREVRREQVVPGAARDRARLRRLVVEVQRLVARVEVDARELRRRALAERLHEAERLGERARRSLVLLAHLGARPARWKNERSQYSGWCTSAKPAAMSERMKLSVSAACWYAVEQSCGSARRASGVNSAAVDEIAEVAREHDAVALLGRLDARLGVLPGEAPDADDRRLARVDEHERHLEEDLELVA